MSVNMMTGEIIGSVMWRKALPGISPVEFRGLIECGRYTLQAS